MGRNFKIVSILVIIVFTLLMFISWNALRVERTFVVLYNTELGFCFLVDNGYEYELSDTSFTYRGRKNHGKIELLKRGLSSDITKTTMNNFKAGYKKIKNKRIYEFKLNEKFILKDTFEIIERMPVNLVPYNESCTKIKMNFKKHIEIFKGV